VTNWKIAALLAVLTAASACGGEGRQGERTLSRDRFIETNVALRQIERSAENADSLRGVTLAEHGVTEEQMRAFVSARSDRPAELAEIWGEIHQRLFEAEQPTTIDEQQAAELELPFPAESENPAAAKQDAGIVKQPSAPQDPSVSPDTSGAGQRRPSIRAPERIRRAVGRPALETVQ
jgi:hypothetical protein